MYQLREVRSSACSMNIDKICGWIVVGVAGLLGGLMLGRRERTGSSRGKEFDATNAASVQTEPLPTGSPSSELIESPTESPQLMLGIVDVVDEIELMKSRASAAEQGSLSAIHDRLRDLVELSGGELIRETSWQPALQRAVKVEPAEPGQTDVRYLQTRATGLKHAGRIIRKQEVVVSQPKP
jgi:hypothetical protein